MAKSHVLRTLTSYGGTPSAEGSMRAHDGGALSAIVEEQRPSGTGDGVPTPEILWTQFSPLVRKTVRRVLGDEEVEDQVQEIFFRLFHSLPRLRDPQALPAFVYKITARVVASALRQRRLRRWLRFLPHDSLPELPAPPRDDDGREALQRVYRLLARLKDRDRLIFVLHMVEGLELTTVAQAVGVSLATVKRRLAHVQERLDRWVLQDPLIGSYLGLGPSRGGRS